MNPDTRSRHGSARIPAQRSTGRQGQRQPRGPAAADLLNFGWASALMVATVPLAFSHRPTPPLGVLAHAAGLLAGYGAVIVVLLVARAPGLERTVGADVLTRWHATAGRTVVVAVLIHAWAATAAWASARKESTATAFGQVVRMPWIPAATVATGLLLVVAAVSVRAARRRLSHERWHALHLLMYLAVALSLGHQLAGPDLAGHRWFQIAWALLYAHTFAAVLQHRILSPVRAAMRHRLQVGAVYQESPGVVSILVTGHELRSLQAQPGQFFRWRFLTPDHWRTAHPFSLSAAPDDRCLRLTVKALGDGSANLQNLPVGTWVVAEGPYGAMTARRRTRGNVLLIAGGVGITPMRALFESIPLDADQDMLLLYRARDETGLIFRDELDEIARDPARRVRYLLGEDRDTFTAAGLRRAVPDVVGRDVYLCGPPQLCDAVRAALTSLGLPSDRLHEERFAF